MKKYVCAVAVLLILLCFQISALSDDSIPTYTIGEGGTEFLVIIAEAADLNVGINVFVRTDESQLMNVLTDLDFIEVEKASWGYYVTSVLGIEPSGGGYWSILEYDDESYKDLSEPVQSTMVNDGDVYAFILYEG